MNVMRYVLDHEVASTYASDVEGSLEVLECGLASVGTLSCSYVDDYVEEIVMNVIHVFHMVYEKYSDAKNMPGTLSRLVLDPVGPWSLLWEVRSFAFDPGGLL
ncbi:hypothetical protein GOP47_0021401 [Adiantum capillus-veneris]|uniref:Uncharacterized protein n=1 Tax=Adiantum capillus-veneris TaxID=13818 RepID=A0A9D4U7A4_ADICA|nr:hypothetical protein GOP47_0021401 [Adiantum capillus-veneris]